MAATNPKPSSRYVLACWTMGCSGFAIAILALASILLERDNTMTIFNITLPVFASWVGTILAFYFGRENFESANQQVRDIVAQIHPEQRGRALVTTIMRPFTDMGYFKIEEGKTEGDVKLSDLTPSFTDKVTRLPILDAGQRPKYMLHASSIDKYQAEGGALDHSLKMFLENRRQAGLEYGVNKGFVVASKQTSLEAAKHKMQAVASCQDIFITSGGSEDEPLAGWISNLRMAKYLEV